MPNDRYIPGDRLYARRLARWIISECLDGDGAEHACSRRYCDVQEDLRLTPSGPWCEQHYLDTEPCMEPGCEEPVVDNGQCRNHWLTTLPPLRIEDYTLRDRCALGMVSGGPSALVDDRQEDEPVEESVAE